MNEARRLIEALRLQPHPEGGWYRETWRAPAADGVRAAATAIYFLLESRQRSHWHRVDAAEVWCWHAGDALRLSVAETDYTRPVHRILGPDVLGEEEVQTVVPACWWQAAEPQPGGRAGFVLMSCVVAPAFEFAGFELAPADWSPGPASGFDG